MIWAILYLATAFLLAYDIATVRDRPKSTTIILYLALLANAIAAAFSI